MKLNPPASSSDLETAREIARRLHQRRRREDRPREDGPLATPAPRPQPPPRPQPAPRPQPLPPPAPPELPGLDDIPGFDAPASPIEESMPAIDEPEIDIGEPSVSPEEMVDSREAPDEDPPAEGLATDSSPFEVDVEDETGQPLESPLPPSWDGVAEACRGLAQARGALLASPSGEVFAVRGDWPEPGPNAIAVKLVSMMNRTLKDAPTRSISAPLMGMHLTAWRVPLDQGLVTAAFIADAPVRAEARPAIDTEIHRAAGI